MKIICRTLWKTPKQNCIHLSIVLPWLLSNIYFLGVVDIQIRGSIDTDYISLPPSSFLKDIQKTAIFWKPDILTDSKILHAAHFTLCFSFMNMYTESSEKNNQKFSQFLFLMGIQAVCACNVTTSPEIHLSLDKGYLLLLLLMD